MEIKIREFNPKDVPQMLPIWNEVVDAGIAFPQIDPLTKRSAHIFFSDQSFTGIAEAPAMSELLGLYILHPNNIGRCGHIANASFAVASHARGQRIGEKLVRHSLQKAKNLGFKIMQFNAVVKTNHYAIKLYTALGFVQLGTIPKGFLMKDGTFEDIIPFYKTL